MIELKEGSGVVAAINALPPDNGAIDHVKDISRCMHVALLGEDGFPKLSEKLGHCISLISDLVG
eukprot:7815153-Pyramimonas_sp.AAC.1